MDMKNPFSVRRNSRSQQDEYHPSPQSLSKSPEKESPKKEQKNWQKEREAFIKAMRVSK